MFRLKKSMLSSRITTQSSHPFVSGRLSFLSPNKIDFLIYLIWKFMSLIYHLSSPSTIEVFTCTLPVPVMQFFLHQLFVRRNILSNCIWFWNILVHMIFSSNFLLDIMLHFLTNLKRSNGKTISKKRFKNYHYLSLLFM